MARTKRTTPRKRITAKPVKISIRKGGGGGGGLKVPTRPKAPRPSVRRR